MSTPEIESVLLAAERWSSDHGDSLALSVAVEAWVAAGRPGTNAHAVAVEAARAARDSLRDRFAALKGTRGSVWLARGKWRAEVAHNRKRRALGVHTTEALAWAAVNAELARLGRQQSRARRAVSHGMRFRVLERDGYRCVYCGATAAESALHVDHVKPFSKGGADEMANLVAACEACNLGKHAREITHDSAQASENHHAPGPI